MNRENDQLHICRVCGLYTIDLPWGSDGKCPNYFICSCCGRESGYEDCSLKSTKAYRLKWFNGDFSWQKRKLINFITNRKEWFVSKDKPKNWNREEQMKNIPEEWR